MQVKNINIKKELFSTTNGLLDIVKMKTLSDIQKVILPNIEYYKVRRLLTPLVEKNNPIIIEKLKKVLSNYTLEIFYSLFHKEYEMDTVLDMYCISAYNNISNIPYILLYL